jgi:predicted dienelactone hydrolase
MKKLSLFLICFMSFYSMAQFAVGHTTITFNDPARTGGFGSGGGPGRQIQTEIYYPAGSAGNNVPVSAGEFPIISFGHGFAMSWDAYANIWEALASRGYIIAFPRTEGGLIPGPSHGDFGLDLALVANRMLELNSNSASIFHNKINGNAGIMGHSMGGGASFLAAGGNSNIKTVVGLAPAETNPSAVTAAASVTVPTLVLSGSSDGVTPPAEHHLPIYNAVTGTCKYFLSITGGAHCYFANTNFNCDFGEGSSSTGITIQRAQQQATMIDYIVPWFDYHLKNICSGWTAFTSPQATDTRITPSSTCSVTLPTTPVITLGTNVLISSVTTNIQWYLNGQILAGETNATCPLSYGNGSYTVVNTANPNCDAVSEPYVYSGGTGSVDKLNFAYSVQPNPASDIFNVIISNNQEFEVEVYSINGQLITVSSGVNSITFQTSDWNKGVYLVKITQNGYVQNSRVVVK